jgi:hypothetical protein
MRRVRQSRRKTVLHPNPPPPWEEGTKSCHLSDRRDRDAIDRRRMRGIFPNRVERSAFFIGLAMCKSHPDLIARTRSSPIADAVSATILVCAAPCARSHSRIARVAA